MATKKKSPDPLKLIAGKRPTVASLPLCMDPEAFERLGLAKKALDEAEARMQGLLARQRALDESTSLDVQIAEVEAEIEEAKDPAEVARLQGRLSQLRVRHSLSGGARVQVEIDKQKPVVDEAREEFEAAEAGVDAATVTFRARAIPQKQIRRLIRDHPPTQEQLDAFEEEMKEEEAPEAIISRGLPYNSDTYPPALISACLVSPKMSEDEVSEMIWMSDNWNEKEKEALFQLVLTAINTVPLSR